LSSIISLLSATSPLLYVLESFGFLKKGLIIEDNNANKISTDEKMIVYVSIVNIIY
jgi:hypothetical protein